MTDDISSPFLDTYEENRIITEGQKDWKASAVIQGEQKEEKSRG